MNEQRETSPDRLFGEEAAGETAAQTEMLSEAPTESEGETAQSHEEERLDEAPAEDVFAEASRAVKENAHFADLERQAQALKATYPDFDLKAELRNPVFARMTAPDIGISLEDAYYAVHRKELHAAAMREAAEKTAAKLAVAIRSGSRRPIEAGASSQAPSVTAFDYAKASREQREAFKKDLRARIAKGEKVYPRG